MERPNLELADVVRKHAAALGGHVERCAGCGYDRLAYNSCRNRHCPKCLASQQAAWLSRQVEHLLPVDYHHVVFTLPSEVNRLGLLNPTTVYKALLGAAAETIRDVAANPKHLGAQVGLLLVLHTWGQTLSYHPHVHGIATGGGLTPTGQWRSCRPGFFLPVRVLSRVFREKFLARLREAMARDELAGFDDATAFTSWCRDLESKEWVVYAKPPFGGPQQVLKLGITQLAV